MSDRIQSWASVLAGAAVVVLALWLTMGQMSRTHVRAERDSGAAPAAAASAPTSETSDDASAPTPAEPNADTTGVLAKLDPDADGGFALGNLDTLLADSGAMPSGAPHAVRLGVVLVQFAGAEGSSSSARAKPDARAHAAELAEQAKSDWKAAVKAGDQGSSEDIGRVPRGVLDARTEVRVFSLAKDEISEPLETPRGYWVVKRID